MQRTYFNIRWLADHGRGFGLVRSQSDDWKAMLYYLFPSINEDHHSSFFFSFILFPLLCGVDLYDDIRLHVAQPLSYTSSADCLFNLMSSFTLSSHLLLCLPLFLLSFRAYFSLASPSFLRSVPLFSSQTTSTFFPVLLCDFPHFLCPSYSFISDLVQRRNSAHLHTH